MTQALAIKSCAIFKDGYGTFLKGRQYGVVAMSAGLNHPHLLVEIDPDFRRRPGYLYRLTRREWSDLHSAGTAGVGPLPKLPATLIAAARLADDAIEKGLELPSHVKKAVQLRNTAFAKLAPLIDAAGEIFGAAEPELACNRIARAHGLNVTRVRGRFFLLAAYGFEKNALLPGFWRCGRLAPGAPAPGPGKKRGRKVKDPEVTPTGWPYDEAWLSNMVAGFHDHKDTDTGKPYYKVWVETLESRFDCIDVSEDDEPPRIHNPKGNSFPSYKQFSYHVQKQIGVDVWIEAKQGKHKVRNHSKAAPYQASSSVANLLQEVHWDAQKLRERPGDPANPEVKGEPIWRVHGRDAASGMTVGVGYSYGSERQEAYRMALYCMAMNKKAYCELLGVEIGDGEWISEGLALELRGDRGPAIAQALRDQIAEGLKRSQTFAPSYDPRGKALGEAGHHKYHHREGPPIRKSKYRTVSEIIKDDLRETVKRNNSADQKHRMDLDQAQRGVMGTPSAVWRDMYSKGLYLGRHVDFEEIAPLTMTPYKVSITRQGVKLGAVRYLSPELVEAGLLERAAGKAIEADALAFPIAIKRIWLCYEGRLLPLEAIPIRFNSYEATHELTIDEALAWLEKQNRSRRQSEQIAPAYHMRNTRAARAERQNAELDLKTQGGADSGTPASVAKERSNTIYRRRVA